MRNAAPSEKPTSRTRDCSWTVMDCGTAPPFCKPAMRVGSETNREVHVETVVAALRRGAVDGQRHLAAVEQAAVVDGDGESPRRVAQAQAHAGEVVGRRLG